MDGGTVASIVVAGAGLISAVSAYALGKRGQRNDEKQQSAKTKLEERIAAFDELESLNDRLEKENSRLRDVLAQTEATGDIRLARQARRCREKLDECVAALSALQSVVLAEVARVAAGDAIEDAVRHVAEDHPGTDDTKETQ